MNKKNYVGIGIGMGLCFGVALGAAMHHIGSGIALGLLFGTALGAARKRKTDQSEQGDSSKKSQLDVSAPDKVADERSA